MRARSCASCNAIPYSLFRNDVIDRNRIKSYSRARVLIDSPIIESHKSTFHRQVAVSKIRHFNAAQAEGLTIITLFLFVSACGATNSLGLIRHRSLVVAMILRYGARPDRASNSMRLLFFTRRKLDPE